MNTDAGPTFLARLARRPFPVLLGVAAGFLACCAAGRVAARQQPYKDFVRFHQGVAPESHYYPTYSQVLNLARQHVKPGKVLVVVTGDSVLQGVGQRADHVWTRSLQRRLGDDFVVLNLAMRAGVPQEFGGLVADELAAEGVPLVVVCRGNVVPWDGLMYRYFFWDAWGKGHVRPDSRRDQWLAEYGAKNAKDEAALELRRAGLVDGATYSRDLWNYVAYKYRGTVWTPMKYPRFWEPHRLAADPDPGATLPFEATHTPAVEELTLSILRAIMNSPYGDLLRQGNYAPLGELYSLGIPDRLADRSLYVLRVNGRYYREKLPPAERERFEDFYRRLGAALNQSGLRAKVVGMGYERTDYVDHSHLSESGGEKLAADLAPEIREMAGRLYGVRGTAAGGE